MHFCWYWPFARPEELEWARGTARPGERITVQVIDRDAAPPSGDDGTLSVVRDLPEVRRDVGRGPRWIASRATTYLARERARRRLWNRGEPPDLVHLHYLNRFTDAWAPLPRPVVLSVHDVTPHVARFGRRAERALLARCYERPDALVVHHRRLADLLVTDFDLPADRIHVVAHQVFPTGDASPDAPTDLSTILFFGSLRPNKGLDVLEAAMSALGPDVQITIAGRGDEDEEARVRALAARDGRVRAEIGFASLERKRELFREAAVVVLPYTSFASQSGVLQDAYGHGRPVVVTDVGALGDTVREDSTGIVVPPRAPGELATALTSLTERSSWQQHAAAAQEIARTRSPAAVGARLREVYDEVLG